MKNLNRSLFNSIYLFSFIKNSLFVSGTSFEPILNVVIYFIVFLLVLISLPKTKSLGDKISGEHFFVLIISFFALLYLDDGHTRFFALILMVFLMKLNDDIVFLLSICKFFTICLFIILLLQTTGLYHFKVYAAYNVIKGETVQLGFRNVNTYGAYCYNCFIIFYLFKKWKWFYFALAIVLISTYYTQSRTPLVASGVIILLSVFRTKLFKKKVGISFVAIITFFILLIGFGSIFFVDNLVHLKLFGKFDLNQLSSTRLAIIQKLSSSLTPIEWLIGSSTDVVDSFYIFWITFYGIILSFLMFYSFSKSYMNLVRRSYLDFLIIISVILTIGLFEQPLSPFLPIGVILFCSLFYPTWITQKLREINLNN